MRPIFLGSLLLGFMLALLWALAVAYNSYLLLAGSMFVVAVGLIGTYAVGALGIRRGEGRGLWRPTAFLDVQGWNSGARPDVGG